MQPQLSNAFTAELSKKIAEAYAKVPLLAMGLAVFFIAVAPNLSGAVSTNLAGKAPALTAAAHHNTSSRVFVPLAKRVMDRERGDLRAEEFPSLLNLHGTSCAGRPARLDCLLQSKGDPAVDWTPPGWHTFDDFLYAAPAWKGPDAYVFHVAKKVPLPRRAQFSAPGYVHSAVVIQRYLVSLHQQRDVGMVDVTKLLRDAFSAEELGNHTFDDVGGASRSTLEFILEPGSVLRAGDALDDNLKRHGPGLVHLFKVHSDFFAAGRVSFGGKPDGDVVGEHAMVLIGARRDPTSGEWWYLLQNWWQWSQFVEVTEEYLKASGAEVVFVITPQTKVPEKFPTQPHLIACT